jgi:hypothetical protein
MALLDLKTPPLNRENPKPVIYLHLYLLPLSLSAIACLFALLYLVSDEVSPSEGTSAPTFAENFSWFFDLNSENSAPAWYSTSLWLFAAFLALGAAAQSIERWNRNRWRSLAVVFAFMSLDEAAGIHERIGSVMVYWIKLTGFFYYVWVIYGFFIVIVLTMIYARFILSLPRQVFLTFVLAAAVFLSGALGLEMTGAAVESGQIDFPFGLDWRKAIALEELAEMIGVIILIFGLLLFLKENHSNSGFLCEVTVS